MRQIESTHEGEKLFCWMNFWLEDRNCLQPPDSEMQTMQTMQGYAKIKSPDCSFARSEYSSSWNLLTLLLWSFHPLWRQWNRENLNNTRNWARFLFMFTIYSYHISGIFFHWLTDFISDMLLRTSRLNVGSSVHCKFVKLFMEACFKILHFNRNHFWSSLKYCPKIECLK